MLIILVADNRKLRASLILTFNFKHTFQPVFFFSLISQLLNYLHTIVFNNCFNLYILLLTYSVLDELKILILEKDMYIYTYTVDKINNLINRSSLLHILKPK